MMKALSTGEAIDAYVDVDEVLRYFAANTFVVNLDSYAGSLKHKWLDDVSADTCESIGK